MDQDTLFKILKENSMGVYHVEYNKFLSNHISHGIIALARLGADTNRVQRFIDWYKPRLQTPEIQYDYEGTRVADDHPVQGLLGKRLGYFRLLKHYEELLQKYGSKEKLVQQEFPKLVDGMVCAALHGVIHTGYAWAAGWDQGVCEGLAYLHYSYKPIVFDSPVDENTIKKFGKGNKSAADVVSAVGQDQCLRDAMLKGTEILIPNTKRYIGTGQFRLAVLVTSHGEDLARYANQIHIPVLDTKDGEDLDIGKLGDWLVDVALLVYVAADRRNDFFLLHGVTGAWSLRHLLPLLSPSAAVSCARVFICILLAVFLTEDSPELKHGVEDLPDITEASWKPVFDSVLARDLDEHVYKLVQVCHDMWKENPDSPSSSLYLSAARLADNEPLRFADFPDLKLIEH